MILRRGAVTAAVVIATAFLAGGHQAAAQNDARLDLEAQTLFVDDSAAEVVLRVSDAPDTARIRFTVYDDPALTRSDVRAHHRQPPTSGGRIANFECSLDGDCRDQATLSEGPDGILTVTLPDDEIGESLRSRPGALPLVVQLLDEDDELLDELVTSLIVLDDTAPTSTGPFRVRVAFTSRVVAPVALQPDLRYDLDVDALLSAASAITELDELAVTTELRPETLDALTASDPTALDELLTIIGDRPLLRGPWVDMDEEAWRRAGESDQVVAQYALGNDTLESIVGEPPTGLVRLDPDAGPETLALLRSAGANAVLVADGQLDADTRSVAPTQPFQLLDANGVAITALRYDEDLHDTLDDDDPELAAYRAITELAIAAEAAVTDLGVLLDLDRLDTEVLMRLVEGIDGRSAIEVTDVEELVPRELARIDGETLRGELAPTDAPDVSGLAAELESAVGGIATLARMLDPQVELLDPYVGLLQVAVSADLDPQAADAYVDRINEEITRRTTGLEIPAGDRVTLTARRADLPLTIVNGQPFPLTVELLLTAEKVRFPEGGRVELVLQPGDNPITIPVETLASGDARVTATIVSPGGFFELARGTVDIRSTAISGLGLVISIVALLVLAIWWIRSIVRVRRNRVTATVSAESEEEARATDAPPTEGES